jgi:hypothetical protein
MCGPVVEQSQVALALQSEHRLVDLACRLRHGRQVFPGNLDEQSRVPDQVGVDAHPAVGVGRVGAARSPWTARAPETRGAAPRVDGGDAGRGGTADGGRGGSGGTARSGNG